MIKIDRHNYEEFFILYLDNELTEEERRQVDLFVQDNPDLKNDLDILMQSVVAPDEDILFPHKEVLLKQDDQLSISLNNYEEWLLLYTDNELDQEQKKKVEDFTSTHPAIREELEILQKTKLQPEEAIVFLNKESLYRSEEKVRVIPFRWKRIAAAAAVLLAVGITSALIYNRNSTPPADLAITTRKVVPPATTAPIDKPAMKETPALADPVLADNSGDKDPQPFRENIPVEIKKKNIHTNNPVVPMRVVEPLKESIAKQEEKKQDNNLPKPTYNPNMKAIDVPADALASNQPSINAALTNPKEIKPQMGVTRENPQPLYTSNTSTGSDDDQAVDEPGKKNKLRGFFRKITRTFEKNTNIKATDEDDRLLLGGLAIKL